VLVPKVLFPKKCRKENTHTHTHTHLFNGPFSGTTQVSRYQKVKINLDFTEASDSEWQWHQLGRMQVCTSLQTDNHATPHDSVFTGRMPRQSTEGRKPTRNRLTKVHLVTVVRTEMMLEVEVREDFVLC